MLFYEAKVLVCVPETPRYSMDCSCDEVFVLEQVLRKPDYPRNVDKFKMLSPVRSSIRLVGYKNISKEDAKKKWNDIYTEEGGI